MTLSASELADVRPASDDVRHTSDVRRAAVRGLFYDQIRTAAGCWAGRTESEQTPPR